MRRLYLVSIAIVLLFASACATQAPAATTSTEPTEAAAVEPTEEAAAEPTEEATAEPTEEAAAESEPTEAEFIDFDPSNFTDSTNITNEWLPLQPGTKWVHEGITIENGEDIPHRIEFTVTDLTKEIAGVRTAVAWIVDISDDQVVEIEIAFYAQDNDGNVWYFGEHPEEYDNGEFVKAATWLAGLEEARPGLKMHADPQVGMPSYFQGWGPAVEWNDYGRIDQVVEEDCVSVGCYQDVLVIDESSLGETDIYQVKSYARGVGNIRVGWKGEAESREELELVEFTQLDPDALAAAREEALALEAHAYEISPDVYGQTAPME